jgi:hypothetical protein
MFDKNEMNYLIEQAKIDLETGWDDDNAFQIAEAAFLHGAHIARSKCILVNRKNESIKKFLDKLLDPKGSVMRSRLRCGKTLGSSASG